MPHTNQPPAQPEPGNKQVVVERQAEIIADMEKTNQRLEISKRALVGQISNYDDELKRTDFLCAVITVVGTIGWVLAAYQWIH